MRVKGWGGARQPAGSRRSLPSGGSLLSPLDSDCATNLAVCAAGTPVVHRATVTRAPGSGSEPGMNASSSRPLAIVTGGSSGIGFELAREFAENGFDLVVNASGERIADAARELEATGATVEAIQADLATPTGVEDLYG